MQGYSPRLTKHQDLGFEIRPTRTAGGGPGIRWVWRLIGRHSTEVERANPGWQGVYSTEKQAIRAATKATQGSRESRRVRSTKAHQRTYWEWNHERSRAESAWTWECSCGATESASTKGIAAIEWRNHLLRVRELNEWSEMAHRVLCND